MRDVSGYEFSAISGTELRSGSESDMIEEGSVKAMAGAE